MPIDDPYLIDSHKLSYHPARVAQWQSAQTIEEKLNVFPIYVEISPVGYCNHRCTFCAVDYIGYVKRKIETPVLNLALDNMAQNGVKSVMFAGEGEPMLHPDIVQITNHAAQVGLDVAFTTNGTALTEKFISKALHNVKWIKVSMNGGAASYGKIHQTKQEDYERVWGNIKAAVDSRRKSNAGCAIGVQCVVLPENIQDLDGIARRARETGVDYLVLKPYSQHKSSITHKHEGVKYSQEYMQQVVSGVKALSNSYFKVIARSQAMEDWDDGAHKYERCNATPYFWAYVMATGDVYSCSAFLLNDEFKLGNVGQSSFKEIWLGDKRKAHITAMESLDISKCRLNCRMNQVNKYLDKIVNPVEHINFI
jgi:radical SAM protein with 4Fe4S-binding SPASM domain